MKVVNLLNKIANYEGVPKFFRINGEEYCINNDGYIQERNGKLVEWLIYRSWLNEEVEIIIEEDKQENEIQLIEYNLDDDTLKTFIKGKYVFVDIPENYRDIIDFYKNKINELIDEINNLKKGDKDGIMD